jgi:hypothetical protein
VSDPLTTALEIADAIASEFVTDPARQYITGLSMGGYGTWDSIIRNPDRFAAALPICGAGDPTKADLIKQLPLWTFHGDIDPTVPVKGSRQMVAALEAVGSTIRYTEYPGVMHDAWDMTYANEEVIDWLFQFKKAAPSVGGSGGMGGTSGMSGMGGAGSGGVAGTEAGMGGAAGSNAASGRATGGSSAGMAAGGSSAGTPNQAAGTSSAGTGETPSDDSSCSLRPGETEHEHAASLMLLGGCAALSLQRRRSRRAA